MVEIWTCTCNLCLGLMIFLLVLLKILSYKDPWQRMDWWDSWLFGWYSSLFYPTSIFDKGWTDGTRDFLVGTPQNFIVQGSLTNDGLVGLVTFWLGLLTILSYKYLWQRMDWWDSWLFGWDSAKVYPTIQGWLYPWSYRMLLI